VGRNAPFQEFVVKFETLPCSRSEGGQERTTFRVSGQEFGDHFAGIFGIEPSAHLTIEIEPNGDATFAFELLPDSEPASLEPLPPSGMFDHSK
jgi:hypothetical protein